MEAMMPKAGLKDMDVDALLALRADIDKRLDQERHQIQNQLSRLGGGIKMDGAKQPERGRASALKGRKVKPKYRDPKTGQTWAGRGARPRWLVAAMKGGKKLDSFMIEKSGR
jgi:DNA-binding protein H-NS